uniref:DUF1801 domain-containing protein n=1 Tax=Caenorhabditis tropicalis TaxID=1561998 RepID=A0A1I7TSP6_9PELO
MFVAPRPVAVKQMLSEEEINKVHGKIRGLNKLREHPVSFRLSISDNCRLSVQRMALAELQEPLNILMFNLNSMIYFGRFQYNEEMKSYMTAGVELTKTIEDLIIRVVLRGENIEEVKVYLQEQCK